MLNIGCVQGLLSVYVEQYTNIGDYMLLTANITRTKYLFTSQRVVSALKYTMKT
jgi:hypothetical protein